MKLNKNNAATDKYFPFPFSLLNIAPKQNSEPTIKKPNPAAISGSNNSGKTYEDQNNSTPNIANTTDNILNFFIMAPPLLTYFTIYPFFLRRYKIIL
jgi:hypothetical protein